MTLTLPHPARAALCGSCTLDGQPAEVRAPLQSEATVQTLDPAGPSIRVPWYLVEAVMRAKGRRFFSPRGLPQVPQ